MLPLIKNRCLNWRDVHMLFSHLKSSLQKEREVGISCMRVLSLKKMSNKGCIYCALEVAAFWWSELMWDPIITLQALFSMEHFDFAGDSFVFVHHIWLLQGTSTIFCFWAESENLDKFYNHHWICPDHPSLPCSVELKSEFDTFVRCSRNPANYGIVPRFSLGSRTVELRWYSEKEQLVLPANTSC